MAAPYAPGSHNILKVPAPPHIRTSSNHSTNSGTASKKATFSYYNDESATGAGSTTSGGIQRLYHNKNESRSKNDKKEQPSSKQDAKTIKQQNIAMSAHNHAKSMHQLEKIIGSKSNN